MEADAGIPLKELRVDGGAAANNLLMQFQADLLGVPVVRPAVTETTALGAAYLAGLAVGFWKSADDVSGQWKVDRRFEPAMPRAAATRCASAGPRRCGRSKGWEIANAGLTSYGRRGNFGWPKSAASARAGWSSTSSAWPADNQQSRRAARDDNDRPGSEVAEVEFVEFSRLAARSSPESAARTQVYCFQSTQLLIIKPEPCTIVGVNWA